MRYCLRGMVFLFTWRKHIPEGLPPVVWLKLPKDHWIKSDQASGEPARAGPGLDFAERRVRGCSVGCSRPRDLKIGTHGYMVMVIKIFRKFSDPGHFKYLPALWFRDFIVNYCKLL